MLPFAPPPRVTGLVENIPFPAENVLVLRSLRHMFLLFPGHVFWNFRKLLCHHDSRVVQERVTRDTREHCCVLARVNALLLQKFGFPSQTSKFIVVEKVRFN